MADPRRYQDARGPLEKYAELEPGGGKGWSLLGRTYYYLRLRDEALQAMTKAESMGGANKEMYTILGRLHAERRDWEKSLAAFARGEPSAREQLTIGQIWVFQGRFAEADSLYQGVVARDSTSKDALFGLNESGKLRFRQQEYPGAISMFQRRIGLDPGNDEAYYYLGLAQKER